MLIFWIFARRKHFEARQCTSLPRNALVGYDMRSCYREMLLPEFRKSFVVHIYWKFYYARWLSRHCPNSICLSLTQSLDPAALQIFMISRQLLSSVSFVSVMGLLCAEQAILRDFNRVQWSTSTLFEKYIKVHTYNWISFLCIRCSPLDSSSSQCDGRMS